MRRISCITVSLSLSLAYMIALPHSQGSEWTDSTGQFHRLGDFVYCDGVEVLLRNGEGARREFVGRT